MRNILADVKKWRSQGEDVALAVVVSTWGSAPRRVGAKMAVSAQGEVSGSVSGGCVESAVIEASRNVLLARVPRLLRFGVADESAWAVGLSCGGSLEVYVAPLDEHLLSKAEGAIADERSLVVATVIDGDPSRVGRRLFVEGSSLEGSLGEDLDRFVTLEAGEVAASGRGGTVSRGETRVFLDVLAPPPRLVIVGGVHIAVALATLAKTLGYVTTLVDPRETFGNRARFPHVDRVLNQWPEDALGGMALDGRTAVAVLTHDPKLDDPALTVALASPAFYVGALGGRATREKRELRLRARGLGEEQLARLKAPIGLDLGGRSPEEIALAVMAEIVAARNEKGAGARGDRKS